MNAQGDASFVFYAKSVEEAQGRAAEILAEHKFERVHLKPWPYEFMRFFRLELPRTVPEKIPRENMQKKIIPSLKGQNHLKQPIEAIEVQT